MVSLVPKDTMSKAPTVNTKGMFFSMIASKRELSQGIMPPTKKSATSVVVISSTP